MKKILLVDDDATIVEIYRQRFVHEGFQVDTAGDGLEAAKALRTHKPDLVVLDLMMPRLSGVEVLKFIRAQPDLESIPVVIFTNSFMSELAEAANGLGIQRAIIKAGCSPEALVGAAREILASTAVAGTAKTQPAKSSHPLVESPAKIRQHFLDHGPETVALVRKLYQEFAETTDPAKRLVQLDGLARKAHFASAVAGLSGCHNVALLTGAFEALLFELQRRATQIDLSTMKTIAMSVDFLEVLFKHARTVPATQPLSARVLVVDDDPLSNHLALAALRHAQLDAHAVENPLTGLEMLQQSHYDLVLLDIEMPDMNGFEVCSTLRALPGYKDTAVIFFSAHSDHASRATGVLSGGNDLIAKPIFPYELALKAVTHLIRSRLPAAPAAEQERGGIAGV